MGIRDECVRLRDLLGLDGWDICWCGDPWCQNPKEDGLGVRLSGVIHVAEYLIDDQTLQCFLHEACHALRHRGGHPPDFWAQLERLVRKHLGRGLNEHQARMKRDYLVE